MIGLARVDKLDLLRLLYGSVVVPPAVREERGLRRSAVWALGTRFVFSYSVDMKNVTVTLPEETALWVRVRAAEQDRSVSRWLAEMLEEMRRHEDDYEVAMERFLARAREPRTLQWMDGRRPTREELHDRAGLR